jgi:hypothetical protein
VNRYFDKPAFAGLVLLMPSTVILLSILLRAVNSETLYFALFIMKKTLNPYIVMNIASLASLVICFADILKINSRIAEDKDDEKLIYNKSFLNISLLCINISYVTIIYLYHEFEKLGNIPIGRG